MTAAKPTVALDPVLDRFWKLVRLATNNPSEGEARSAALAAVKLLVEHKLAVSLPSLPFQRPTGPPPPQPVWEQPGPVSPVADWNYEQFKRRQEEQRKRTQPEREQRRAERAGRWRYDPSTDSFIDPDGNRETRADRERTEWYER